MNSRRPRILTNMAFWQSRTWREATDSIYPASEAGGIEWSAAGQAWRLFRRRAAYDVVLTMGIRESMVYGALCRLTGRPSKQVMCEVFLDAPRNRSPRWRLKTGLYRRVASSSLGMLTNSSAEVSWLGERLGIPRERIRYVPLNTTISEPALSGRDDGFILAAGRTQRDYPTLLGAAVRVNAPFILICGQSDLRNETIPPNVSVLREVDRRGYLDHLERARLVVVPLLPVERATGQVVVLEAMAKGKPVIATRAAGTVDHVRDGENGLLVGPGDARQLAEAIQALWSDADRRRRLAERALQDVRTVWSTEQHARAKLEAIRELWEKSL